MTPPNQPPEGPTWRTLRPPPHPLREALEAIRDYQWPNIVGHTSHAVDMPFSGAISEMRFPVASETALQAFEAVKAIALAALSDTPRGREEEGKQGLMASRDLGPTTVASSLKGSDVGEVKP